MTSGALGLTQRERTLLVACLGSGAAAREAFAAWRPFANPVEMHGRELRLMPLLLANLRREGIDDPILPWLRGQAKLIWLTGMMRRRALTRALDALAAADIPVTLIKGAALLVRWPKAVDTRPMGDFDLLVPRERVRAALDALIAAGWTGPRGAQISDDDIDRFHAVGLITIGADGTTRGGTQIDLHWRAAEAVSDPRHTEGLVRRAVAGRFEGRPVKVTGLADHLFVLLAHAFHDTVMQRYDWVAEGALLLEAGARGDWDWPLFHRLCRRYGLEAWAGAALREIAAITARPLPEGADFPDAVVRSLRGRDVAADAADAALPKLEEAFARARKSVGDSARLAAIGADGLDLGSASAGASLVEGWSVPEARGRWSDARAAILAFRAPEARIGERVALRLWLLPYLAAQVPRLDADAWAGAAPERWSFVAGVGDSGCRTLTGRVRAWAGVPVIVVAFRFETLLTGAERRAFGLDHRLIGLRLSRVEMVRERAAPVIGRSLLLRDPPAERIAWSGWGGAEETGRWTVGEEAVLRFRLPQDGPVRAIRFEAPMVFCRTGAGQGVEVIVNGKPGRALVLPDEAGPRRAGLCPGAMFEVDLPPGTRRGALVDLRLRIADPVAPAALGLSLDRRPIGLHLAEITLVPGEPPNKVSGWFDRLRSAWNGGRG